MRGSLAAELLDFDGLRIVNALHRIKKVPSLAAE
jgi:hypothetical protein